MARYDGTILIRYAGKVVPEAAFQKMLSVSSAPWGCAFAADGSLMAQWEKDPNTVKGLTDIQEAYKDQQLVYFFGKYPNNFEEDDLQPYIVLADDQDNPVIFGFIEGMFDRHSPENPQRADAYYAIENIVLPQVQQYFEVFNGDISKVMEALDKPTPHRLLSHMCNDNGCGTLVLLASTGQIKTFSKNHAWKDYEWGRLSQSHGYAEAGYPDKHEATPAFGNKKPSRIKASVPATPEPEKKVESPEVKKVGDTTIHMPPKAPIIAPTDTAVQPERSELVKVKMPVNLTNKEAQKWIFNRVGVIPHGREEGWRAVKQRGWLMIPSASVKKEDIILEAAKTAQPATITKTFADAAKVLEQREHKNVEPEHVTPTDTPVIPATQKRDFETKFLQSASVKRSLEGKHSPQTLAEIEAIEKKFASYSEATGQHLEQSFRFTPEDVLVLCLNYPNLMQVLYLSTRNSLMKLLAEQREEDGVQETPAPRKSRIKTG